MKPTIYRIESALPYRLSIVARPRGGDWLCDEIHGLSADGVQLLISMLTDEEAGELGLSDEGNHCEYEGIVFRNVPVQDRSVPTDRRQFLDVVEQTAADVKSGRDVAVHCRAGIGRSSVFVASVLVRLGWSVEEAFKAIEGARGCAVPDTPSQKAWVRQNVFPE
jgi:protein-tyrosine phosphatase